MILEGTQRRQCILFSVVFTPPSSSHHVSFWLLPVSYLLLTYTVSLVRACLFIWLERFRDSQKEVGLLVFNPLWRHISISKCHIGGKLLFPGNNFAYILQVLPTEAVFKVHKLSASELLMQVCGKVTGHRARIRFQGIESASQYCTVYPGGQVRQIGLSYRPARLGIGSWAP